MEALQYIYTSWKNGDSTRASLNIQRAASGEKIYRQSKQKFARIVAPLRRVFVTNDGKDAADSQCDEFFRGTLKKMLITILKHNSFERYGNVKYFSTCPL